MKQFHLILLLFLSFKLQAQNRVLDSLIVKYKTVATDTEKVQILIKIGGINANAGDMHKARQNFNDVLLISINAKYYFGIAAGYNSIGRIYLQKGELPKALNYFIKSLTVCEKQKIISGLSSAYANIGIVYDSQENYDKALEYHQKSLEIDRTLGNKKGEATSLNSIGNIYFQKNKLSKVIECYTLALHLKNEIGDKHGAASTLGNIGNVYFYQKNYKKTRLYYLQALKILEDEEDKQGVAMLLNNIAEVYRVERDFIRALEFSKRSLELSKAVESLDDIKSAFYTISSIYEESGKSDLALLNYKKYIQLKDSIYNKENTVKTVETEMNYNFSKKENAVKLENQRKELIHQENIKKQKLVIYFGSGILLLVIGFAIFAYRNSVQKQKINNLLSKQKEEILIQRNEIELQKLIVDEKNKDVTDSIKYAKRIQEAIFPPAEQVERLLPQSFILFKPKDIVSGDFYWLDEYNDNIFFAAVDCTGHGVPGSFMSIVGFNLLQHAIHQHLKLKPNEILDQVNRDLSQTLRQSFEDGGVKDGMDMVLCRYNKITNRLEFAGANNSLYLIRDKELIIYKGDKQPIGAFIGQTLKNFNNNSIDVLKGDQIYIFTDGYADQFGGKQGKKFKYKQFENLLLTNCELPMFQQKEMLEAAIEDWMQGYAQVDDILVMGIKLI